MRVGNRGRASHRVRDVGIIAEIIAGMSGFKRSEITAHRAGGRIVRRQAEESVLRTGGFVDSHIGKRIGRQRNLRDVIDDRHFERTIERDVVTIAVGGLNQCTEIDRVVRRVNAVVLQRCIFVRGPRRRRIVIDRIEQLHDVVAVRRHVQVEDHMRVLSAPGRRDKVTGKWATGGNRKVQIISVRRQTEGVERRQRARELATGDERETALSVRAEVHQTRQRARRIRCAQQVCAAKEVRAGAVRQQIENIVFIDSRGLGRIHHQSRAIVQECHPAAEVQRLRGDVAVSVGHRDRQSHQITSQADAFVVATGVKLVNRTILRERRAASRGIDRQREDEEGRVALVTRHIAGDRIAALRQHHCRVGRAVDQIGRTGHKVQRVTDCPAVSALHHRERRSKILRVDCVAKTRIRRGAIRQEAFVDRQRRHRLVYGYRGHVVLNVDKDRRRVRCDIAVVRHDNREGVAIRDYIGAVVLSRALSHGRVERIGVMADAGSSVIVGNHQRAVAVRANDR